MAPGYYYHHGVMSPNGVTSGFEWLFPVKRDNTPAGSPQSNDASASASTGNHLPRIGGSFGAFVALVVVLATIVLFCCIAIFILLYTHKPDEYERHYRKTVFGKRESSIYEAPLGPQGMRDKFKNLIGRGKKSEGWIKANDGTDEWDASDHGLGQTSKGGFRTRSGMVNGAIGVADEGTGMTGFSHTKSSYPCDAPFTPPSHRPPMIHRQSTSESIELSVPSHGVVAAAAASPPSFPLPNDMTTTLPSLSREGGGVSASSSSQSPTSPYEVHRFDGGSKFKESI